MSASVQKLLIVGEPQTGKSSLIQQFLDYDGDRIRGSAKPSTIKNTNSDFSLKIIKIEGEKVRL